MARRRPKWLEQALNNLLHLELLDIDVETLLPSNEDYSWQVGELGAPAKLLGRYGEAEVYERLEHYGIAGKLHEAGFTNLRTMVIARERRVWEVRIYNGASRRDNLLAEAFIHDGAFSTHADCAKNLHGVVLPMIFIQWLCLQNPFAPFDTQRPAFPGQRHPGLKIGKDILQIFIAMGERNSYGGLANTPEYLHNSVLYAYKFHYLNPVTEGKLQALMRDLEAYPLSHLSWGRLLNCVIEEGVGTEFEWFHEEQILPLNERLKAHFDSREYKLLRREARESTHFRFDSERFEAHCPLNPDGSPKVGVDEVIGRALRC